MPREGNNAWQARIKGFAEFSVTEHVFYVITACTLFMLGSPSHFSYPVSAVGLS
jgi:hypothetical protein